MKVHYPKLYNMAHLLSLNVFTASKGSNNYILFNPSAGADEALRPFSFFRIIILTVFPIQMHRQPMLTLP